MPCGAKLWKNGRMPANRTMQDPAYGTASGAQR